MTSSKGRYWQTVDVSSPWVRIEGKLRSDLVIMGKLLSHGTSIIKHWHWTGNVPEPWQLYECRIGWLSTGMDTPPVLMSNVTYKDRGQTPDQPTAGVSARSGPGLGTSDWPREWVNFSRGAGPVGSVSFVASSYRLSSFAVRQRAARLSSFSIPPFFTL